MSGAQTTSETTKASAGLRPINFYLIVGLIYFADQMSKFWIQRQMIFGQSRPLIGNTVRLTLTVNTGGAWGVAPHSNGIFVAFAILAAIALIYAYHKIARTDLLVGAAFAFALGGAFGNLTDRLRFGHVIDFIDAQFRLFAWPVHWAIFNIADSAITISIVLLVLHFFWPAPRERHTDSKTDTVTVRQTAEDVSGSAIE